MSRLKLLPFRELGKIADRSGFHWVRAQGSHHVFRAADGRIVVIPDHGSQVIVRSLLRKIIRDMGLTVDEYNELAESIVHLPYVTLLDSGSENEPSARDARRFQRAWRLFSSLA